MCSKYLLNLWIANTGIILGNLRNFARVQWEHWLHIRLIPCLIHAINRTTIYRSRVPRLFSQMELNEYSQTPHHADLGKICKERFPDIWHFIFLDYVIIIIWRLPVEFVNLSTLTSKLSTFVYRKQHCVGQTDVIFFHGAEAQIVKHFITTRVDYIT